MLRFYQRPFARTYAKALRFFFELVGFFAVILALPVAAVDTKIVKNAAGNCQISVPADWTVTAGIGLANSSDKKVTAVVSSPKYGDTSFSHVHEMAPMMYPDDKIIKNSTSEFQMEGKSGNGKPNVYRAFLPEKLRAS